MRLGCRGVLRPSTGDTEFMADGFQQAADFLARRGAFSIEKPLGLRVKCPLQKPSRTGPS
jgi:hypothetical protein